MWIFIVGFNLLYYFRFTWGVGQEAAGVELQLLHEADLAVVAETVEVPLAQNEDGGGGVGEGGHGEVEGLFSQDKRPIRLEENTHTGLQCTTISK